MCRTPYARLRASHGGSYTRASKTSKTIQFSNVFVRGKKGGGEGGRGGGGERGEEDEEKEKEGEHLFNPFVSRIKLLNPFVSLIKFVFAKSPPLRSPNNF